MIIADYHNYFGYKFPRPKLDSIAVPGGFQGAMENWGAITYNDQLLLLSAVAGRHLVERKLCLLDGLEGPPWAPMRRRSSDCTRGTGRD